MAANPYLYNIATEAELSEVLSHYSTSYVLDVLKANINGRYNPNSIMVAQPNLVVAWENNFKQMRSYYSYPEFLERISEVRDQTYYEIIKGICDAFNLSFTDDENVDLYSAAAFLYDFFVANFNKYLINFYSSTIYKERTGLYDDLNLAALKKSKDSTTTYGKKLYKDIKLIVINTAIDRVVSAVSEMEFRLQDIFATTLEPSKGMYMASLVGEKGSLFKETYGLSMQSPIRPVLLTEIRFSLQQLAGLQDDLNLIGEKDNGSAE